MDQVLGRLVPVLGLLGHHAVENGHHVVRQVGDELPGIERLDVLVMVQLLGGRSFRYGRLAGQHVVERAAERIDVAAHVGLRGSSACSGEI